jgi:hypothetical protein
MDAGQKVYIINKISQERNRGTETESTAKILPPTREETETARKELRAELAKSERQPLAEKRGANEVFAEKRTNSRQAISKGGAKTL